MSVKVFGITRPVRDNFGLRYNIEHDRYLVCKRIGKYLFEIFVSERIAKFILWLFDGYENE